jgi:AcrR family transcriptional regulator
VHDGKVTKRRTRVTTLRAEIASLKRQRVLEAAVELFFNHGYAATTLQMVAEALGMTKPFIYSYFTNKAEILTAISETGIDQSLAALHKGQAESERAVEQLRIAMATGARSVIRFQRYVVVYQRELKSLAPEDAARILQKRSQFDREVANMITRGIAEGDMHVDDPTMTAVWVGGLLSWLPVWHNPGGHRDLERIINEFVDAIDRLVGVRQ